MALCKLPWLQMLLKKIHKQLSVDQIKCCLRWMGLQNKLLLKNKNFIPFKTKFLQASIRSSPQYDLMLFSRLCFLLHSFHISYALAWCAYFSSCLHSCVHTSWSVLSPWTPNFQIQKLFKVSKIPPLQGHSTVNKLGFICFLWDLLLVFFTYLILLFDCFLH